MSMAMPPCKFHLSDLSNYLQIDLLVLGYVIKPRLTGTRPVTGSIDEQ